jgi:hypothetical protein
MKAKPVKKVIESQESKSVGTGAKLQEITGMKMQVSA